MCCRGYTLRYAERSVRKALFQQQNRMSLQTTECLKNTSIGEGIQITLRVPKSLQFIGLIVGDIL